MDNWYYYYLNLEEKKEIKKRKKNTLRIKEQIEKIYEEIELKEKKVDLLLEMIVPLDDLIDVAFERLKEKHET